MTQYRVECTYPEYTWSTVDFPDGKTWDDVKDWYVKWDSLHLWFKGADGFIEIEMHSSSDREWKRPSTLTIYPVDEEGEADYGTIVVETAG